MDENEVTMAALHILTKMPLDSEFMALALQRALELIPVLFGKHDREGGGKSSD